MGTYDPFAPYILGLSWVPIHQENYLPDDTVERGYSCLIPTAATLVSGGIFVAEPPTDTAAQVADAIFIYPEGLEDQTGPIEMVTIPASGMTESGGATGTFADLLNPSDGAAVVLDVDDEIFVAFDTAAFQTALQGKRIVDVTIAYTASFDASTGAHRFFLNLFDITSLATAILPVASPMRATNDDESTVIIRVPLGELNFFGTPGVGSFARFNVYPWRWEELNHFRTASAFRVNFDNHASSTSALRIGYAALEVRYCEERRLGYGGKAVNTAIPYQAGLRMVQLRDTSHNNNIALTINTRLTLALTHGRVGEISDGWENLARFSALRQSYALPSHPGRLVRRTTALDQAFTQESADALTPVVLYTAATAVTGTHPYHDQIAAPVYGAITATQEVDGTRLPANQTYHQVRFYARRFGNTTQPLVLTRSGITAQITPHDFDALPEIVDGWKEVTLRLSSAQVFTAGTFQIWVWSATSEVAGSRWEVLGARTVVVAGSLAPSRVTYNDWVNAVTNGNSFNATWKDLNDSAPVNDFSADITLLMATDAPQVTGFALETLSQSITGIGLECGLAPDCIPTAIYGNELSWSAPPGIILDTYDNRTVVSGWGMASDVPLSWSIASGPVTGYAVTGGEGRISATPIPGVLSRIMIGSAAYPDVLVKIVAPPGTPAINIDTYIFTHFQDSNNYYQHRLAFVNDGTVTLRTFGLAGGSAMNLSGSIVVGACSDVENAWMMRARVFFDSVLATKVWRVGQPEPDAWTQIAVDSSRAYSTGAVALGLGHAGGATVSFDGFEVTSGVTVDAVFELQRRDIVDEDWQTIMRAGAPRLSFVDYEARVGTQSDYQIRICNVLGFCGPWSAVVSGAPPAPGVVGGGGNGVGVLIFTSNYDPTRNLAHTMAWAGNVVEEFAFPEADQVRLQPMFGRDFVVAFHPLERGGERFERTLLVQAAATALPSLGNFRSLRDMAWADLPYVCVRDERGNRWLAAVLVPSGKVPRNRTLYLAQISVIEVTDTPYPVDPQ